MKNFLGYFFNPTKSALGLFYYTALHSIDKHILTCYNSYKYTQTQHKGLFRGWYTTQLRYSHEYITAMDGLSFLEVEK